MELALDTTIVHCTIPRFDGGSPLRRLTFAAGQEQDMMCESELLACSHSGHAVQRLESYVSITLSIYCSCSICDGLRQPSR